MKLIYFDESKSDDMNPFFFIGGILIDKDSLTSIENNLIRVQREYFSTNELSQKTEFHGQDIFQGCSQYRRQDIPKRLKIFEEIGKIAGSAKIPFILTRINVHKHRLQYRQPVNEYALGLMLIMERFSAFLENEKKNGLLIGDEEQTENTKAILAFNNYKISGGTPFLPGRSIAPLKDTIYFSKSHFSRFIQMADLLVYMASRYEKPETKCTKWHDQQLKDIWENTKKGIDFKLNTWL